MDEFMNVVLGVHEEETTGLNGHVLRRHGAMRSVHTPIEEIHAELHDLGLMPPHDRHDINDLDPSPPTKSRKGAQS